MKKKIIAMALTAVLGLSVFGGTAQAATASREACEHDWADGVLEVIGCYSVNYLNHEVCYVQNRICKKCNDVELVGGSYYEEHNLVLPSAGRTYVCTECGYEEDIP